ncbi:hypothetical protein [Microbacterium sp. CH1]|uniref:hypothetical protein n=1 Tax=Microbacterium sp. CH1 TaxID=1770208 RepID=UPI000B3365F2|nr:hypothetical protein [Microbacterium sp. CH1]
MSFQMNPDFPRWLEARVRALKEVLDGVSAEFAGRPVDEIRHELSKRWASVGDGARITDPDLTTVATRISDGKRVWLEDDGRIMSDD